MALSKRLIRIILLIMASLISACVSTEFDKIFTMDEERISTLKLSENDFIVTYDGFTITPITTLSELIESLGFGNVNDYEINNFGYVSTVDRMQVRVLYYPDYSTPKICVVYHVSLDEDYSYISAIQIYNESYRGLRVGDSMQKVIELYGQPDKKEYTGSLHIYIYNWGDLYLEIAILPNDNKVFYMMYNYYSEIDFEKPQESSDVSIGNEPINMLDTSIGNVIDIQTVAFIETEWAEIDWNQMEFPINPNVVLIPVNLQSITSKEYAFEIGMAIIRNYWKDNKINDFTLHSIVHSTMDNIWRFEYSMDQQDTNTSYLMEHIVFYVVIDGNNGEIIASWLER